MRSYTVYKITITLGVVLFCIHIAKPQALFVEQFNDPVEFQVCGTAPISFTVRNDLGNSMSDIILALEFPDGIAYVPGSVAGAAELTISQLRTPVFRITSLSGKASQRVSLRLASNCATYIYADRGIILKNTLKFGQGGIQDSVISQPGYVLQTPFLIIQDVPQITSEAGNTISRSIEIINTKKGKLSEFIFEDRHDPNVRMSVNIGEVLINDGQLLQIRLRGSDFRMLGNRDEFLDFDEKVIITETITHDNCDPQVINSLFHVRWGCDNSACQQYEEREFIDFQKVKSEANINIKATVQKLNCVCDTLGAEIEYELLNFGAKDATDVCLTILLDTSIQNVNIAAIPDSFTYQSTGQAKIDSIVPITVSKLDCNFIPSISSFKVFISDIAAGETFRFKFKYRTDFNVSPRVHVRFEDILIYKSRCLPAKVNRKTGARQIPFEAQNLSALKFDLTPNIAEWKDGLTRTASFKLIPAENFLDRDLIFNITVPCGLIIVDSSFLINGLAPVEKNVSGATAAKISLRYRGNFLKNQEYILLVPLMLDCDLPCIPRDSLSATRLISSCPEKKSLTSRLIASICYDVRIPCINELPCCYSMFALGLPDVNFACVPEKESTDSIPGYVLFESNVYRASRGRPDTDGDRFYEAGALDSAHIQMHRFITRDTMCHRFTGKIVSDVPNLKFDSIVFSINTQISHDTVYGYFRYKPLSSGEWFECPIGSLTEAQNTNEIPNCFQAKVIQTQLGVGYYSAITPEVLRRAGCPLPHGFRFCDGDSIDFIICRRIAGSTSIVFKDNVVHRVFLHQKSLPERTKFFCDNDLFVVELTTPNLIDVRPKDELLYCNGVIQFPGPVFSGGETTHDFFTREFRELFNYESASFNVPNDINLDSLVILVYYQLASKKDSLVGKHIFYPVLQNNIHHFDLRADPNFSYDESFKCVFIPYGSFKNCTLYRKPGSVQITGTYTIKNVVNKPFYSNDDLRSLLIETKKIYTSIAKIKRPTTELQLSTNEINSSDRQLKWAATFRNATPGFFKIRTGSTQGLIDSFRIASLQNVPIREVEKNCFVIGPFEEFKDYTFQFSALNFSCKKDTLNILASWSCDASFLFPFVDTCFADTFKVLIFNQNPKLALSAQQAAGKIHLCDTLPEYTIRFYNADRGTAYDLSLEIDIPDGVTLIPQSIQYSYPPGSPFQPLPPPTFQSGRTYLWRISELIDDIKRNGLPGFQDSSRNVTIRFKALTDCHSAVNSFFAYRLSGNNNCGESISPQTALSKRIVLEGLKEQSKYLLGLKELNPSRCDDTTRVEIRLSKDEVTSAGDSVSIFIPSPLEYLDPSFVPVQNIRGPLLVAHRGAGQILTVAIPANTAPNTEMIFQISILNRGNKCNEHQLIAKTFASASVYCKTINDSCRVFIQTAEASLDLNKSLPELSLDSLILSPSSKPNRTVAQVFYRIQNKELAATDTLCINIYQDNLPHGMIGGEDILVESRRIAFRDIPRNGTHAIPVEIHSARWLGCHFAAAVLPKSCVCTTDTVFGSYAYFRQQSFTDSSCQQMVKSIGVNPKPNAKYLWTNKELACDTCASNTIKLVNSSDSIQRFDYCLWEYTDSSCAEKYNFSFILFPKATSASQTIRACPGQKVTLLAGNKKHIRWKESGVISNESKLSIVIDRQKIILLCYTDNNHCEVTDTFFLIPHNDLDRVRISPDTTIAFGDTACLYVTKGFRYLWEGNSEMDCDTCAMVKVKPSQTTSYTVTVTDNNDCTINLVTTVRLIFPDCDSSNIFLPNAFSPNQDGINDVLYVRGNFIDRIYLLIYNRWGEKIFETHSLYEGWDGSYRGDMLGPDVFGYYLEVDCLGGKSFRKKGNINLIK